MLSSLHGIEMRNTIEINYYSYFIPGLYENMLVWEWESQKDANWDRRCAKMAFKRKIRKCEQNHA